MASSWRNPRQPDVVADLREAGHEVYDFRNPPNPAHGELLGARGTGSGFQWSEIDPQWQGWNAYAYVDALQHPIAERGFQSDWQAMQWADTGVLVMPCGRSAHLEAGYFTGAGKELYILLASEQEPELMYKMATAICLDVYDLLSCLDRELAHA